MCVCVGAGLLKMKSERGWGEGSLFLFNTFSRFIIFTEITLLFASVTHLEKKHSFMKKSYSKLSKNEPENIP